MENQQMSPMRKHSKKRDAILRCVRSTTIHPSAEWVYQQLKPDYPQLSLGTVYRNLNLFREEGAIASLGVVGGLERFDGNPNPHVHFVCLRCGAVQDVGELQLPVELMQQAEHYISGEIEQCTLSFSGLCSQCKSGDSSPHC